MGVLIQSYLGDEHSRAVQWALETLGVRCEIWQPSLFPSEVTVSVYLRPLSRSKLLRSAEIQLAPHPQRPLGKESTASLADFKLMWLRRRGRRLHHPRLKATDQRFVAQECLHTLVGFELLAGSTITCINDPKAHPAASNKILQLAIAQEVGLPIPDTLISNDPAAVARFFEIYSKVIVKPFEVVIWNEIDEFEIYKSYVSYASLCKHVSSLSLDSISCCASIYQEFIEKISDVRTLICGKHIVSIELLSQRTNHGKIDWRADQESIEARMFTLDDNTSSLLFKFIDLLGIKMGCIDWARKTDGTLVFLEVNPQGQWLWMEEAVPECYALKTFAAFLLDELGMPRPITDLSDITLEHFLQTPYHEILMRERASPKARLGYVDAIHG